MKNICAWSRSLWRSKPQTVRKVPVIAGAGGYSTREVIELAHECEPAGAERHSLRDSGTTTSRLRKVFISITRRLPPRPCRCPSIVYSVQGRTQVNVEPATLQRLAEIENIVAVKEASGNITQIADICCRVPERFAVLSGDDAMTLPVISLGGRGVISDQFYERRFPVRSPK